MDFSQILIVLIFAPYLFIVSIIGSTAAKIAKGDNLFAIPTYKRTLQRLLAGQRFYKNDKAFYANPTIKRLQLAYRSLLLLLVPLVIVIVYVSQHKT